MSILHTSSGGGYLTVPATIVTDTTKLAAVTASAAELNTLTSSGITNADLVRVHATTGTAAQINTATVSSAVTAAAGAWTAAANSGAKVNVHTAAAGVAVTLPQATGSGAIYRLAIKTVVATSPLTVTCFSGDFIAGLILQCKAATAIAFYVANGTSNTVVSLNGTTTGGFIGDYLEFIDVGANRYNVSGVVQGSGSIATPIS